MKKYINNALVVLSAIVLATSCSTDDATGASTLTASDPSLSVSLSFDSSQTLVEEDKEYDFTVTLSEPQIADTRVYLSQVDGTATSGEDFTFPSSVTIPKGATSAMGTITILSDDIIEDTETATIQIVTGSEANISSANSTTVSFTIMNLVEGDLDIGLEWDMSIVTDNAGNEISPTAFADLRLLVTSSPNNSDVVEVADGGSFEHLLLSADTPDGEYYVVADFYDASDIADRDLDLTLTFNQVGSIMDQVHQFPAALNNSSICPANYVVLAKFTKNGDEYMFEEIGESNFAVSQWEGKDVYDFYAPDGWDSQITTTVDCDGMLIYGLNAEWMLNVWGETIEEEGKVYYTISDDGVITIEEQYIFTTDYQGDLYDYTVSGTGTYDDSEDVPMVHLEYKLIQDGFDVAEYWQSQGGMDTPYFVADVTLASEE